MKKGLLEENGAGGSDIKALPSSYSVSIGNFSGGEKDSRVGRRGEKKRTEKRIRNNPFQNQLKQEKRVRLSKKMKEEDGPEVIKRRNATERGEEEKTGIFRPGFNKANNLSPNTTMKREGGES